MSGDYDAAKTYILAEQEKVRSKVVDGIVEGMGKVIQEPISPQDSYTFKKFDGTIKDLNEAVGKLQAALSLKGFIGLEDSYIEEILLSNKRDSSWKHNFDLEKETQRVINDFLSKKAEAPTNRTMSPMPPIPPIPPMPPMPPFVSKAEPEIHLTEEKLKEIMAQADEAEEKASKTECPIYGMYGDIVSIKVPFDSSSAAKGAKVVTKIGDYSVKILAYDYKGNGDETLLGSVTLPDGKQAIVPYFEDGTYTNILSGGSTDDVETQKFELRIVKDMREFKGKMYIQKVNGKVNDVPDAVYYYLEENGEEGKVKRLMEKAGLTNRDIISVVPVRFSYEVPKNF